MSQPKKPEPETEFVEDIPPQVEEDESAWHEQVLKEHIAPSNPKLAQALEALKKRVAGSGK